MNRSKNITMKNVAVEAGVSSMTVSRVLNNDDNVSEKSKQSVLKAVKDLGYQRNLQASSLAGGKKYKIAYFYDDPKCSFMNDVLVSILTSSQQKGYQIVLEPFSMEMLTSVVSSNSVDAVLLAPPYGEFKEVIDVLEESQMPYVRSSAGFEMENTFDTRTDDKKISYDMTKYLMSLGHKKIGFIKGNHTNGCSAFRLEGYKLALEEAGIEYDDALVEQGYFTISSGYEGAKNIIERKPDVTAIFASSDIMAQGVLRYLQEHEIKVPAEISIAGYDDISLASTMYPSLTTVHQPCEEMALAAIDLILNILNGKVKEKSVTKNFASSLVVRDSTGPVRVFECLNKH